MPLSATLPKMVVYVLSKLNSTRLSQCMMLYYFYLFFMMIWVMVYLVHTNTIMQKAVAARMAPYISDGGREEVVGSSSSSLPSLSFVVLPH